MAGSGTGQVIEYFTGCKYYFAPQRDTALVVRKLSGLKMTILSVADQAPIGVTKGAKTRPYSTLSGVECSPVTVECVSTITQPILLTWYQAAHAQAYTGGAMAQSRAESRDKGTLLYIYNGIDETCVTLTFKDAFPISYKSTELSVDGSDMFTETVELGYTGIVRTTS